MGRPVEEPSEVTRLGSYEIVRKLARGGMAELFLARTVGPEGFAKLVVLKKILPAYAENPKFVRLFLDEARLVAGMEHPHIAHVYDMGKADSDYFFAMEYVHGQDVRTTWRRVARTQKPFPIEQAVLIARNIAAALHYAHERVGDDGKLLGVVHRDVSPSNILLSYDGAVKLVDFGVAKAASSSVRTRTGTLKGKISYMSPEQAKGAGIDRRSDVFSLGIVLWELLTGHRLYKAENDLATIQMIINLKPQPPSQLRADSPSKLDAIVSRALSPSISDRYQTAEDMQLDLEALAREQRWEQSEGSLRRFMNELFDDEIRAWMDAHAAGQTLIDHVLAAQPTQLLAPISESELSNPDIVDDDEEDGDDESIDTHAPSTLTSLPPTAPTRAITDSRTAVVPEAPSTSEMTVPQVAMPTRQISVAPPPNPVPAQARYPTPVSGLRAATQPALSDTSLTLPAGQIPAPPAPPAAFPHAPAAWRPTGVAARPGGSSDDRTKLILIASSVVLALVVLIAITLAGRSGHPAASAPPAGSAAPPEMEHKVEMTVVPSAP